MTQNISGSKGDRNNAGVLLSMSGHSHWILLTAPNVDLALALCQCCFVRSLCAVGRCTHDYQLCWPYSWRSLHMTYHLQVPSLNNMPFTHFSEKQKCSRKSQSEPIMFSSPKNISHVLPAWIFRRLIARRLQGIPGGLATLCVQEEPKLICPHAMFSWSNNMLGCLILLLMRSCRWHYVLYSLLC